MQISEIRSRLIKRRKQILEQRNSTNTSWQKLKEPEVEFEETAAKEKMAGVLAQLDDREKQEIEQIDTALVKIRTGGFGMCESCGRQIAESRIKAIPWAGFCIECAEKQEQGPARVAPPLEKSPVLSRDKTGQGHTDIQIKEMIEEQLDLDDRVETDELIVYSEDGWVYLEGCLPAGTQHEILMGIVQDILGFRDIVDQVQIDRQLWERQKYTKQGGNTPFQQWKEKTMHSQGGETDVWTSREFGTPMEPPDKLDPEKKSD
jgi:RNA polymerase-binding protein DksA